MKNKGVLARLIKYPHGAVFDKDPQAGAAFHLNHPNGLKWCIRDEVMTVELSSETLEYDLGKYKVGLLIARMQMDGIQVGNTSPYFFGRSARVLLDGSGDAANLGGDVVVGFKSSLWVTFSAFAAELRLAKSMVSEALKQMIITQAEGEWLDLWGSLYDVPRQPGEQDTDYQSRIPEEAFRLRVNKFAIEKAVLDLTGKRIHLRETWGQMFRLDESRLSVGRLVNGGRWRYGYIEPVAKDLFDWGNILDIIERNKAAGVIVLGPTTEIIRRPEGELDGTISFGILAAYGAYVRQVAENRLDWMRLGNTFPHRNWRTSICSDYVITNTIFGGKWSDTGPGWPAQSWRYGTRADDINGTISLGFLADKSPVSLLYGSPDFKVLGFGLSDAFIISANINRWRGRGNWRSGTWASKGRPVPNKASFSMETINAG